MQEEPRAREQLAGFGAELLAAMPSESRIPAEKSGGVENALPRVTFPSPSTTTQSVHVPPMSMPTTYSITASGPAVDAVVRVGVVAGGELGVEQRAAAGAAGLEQEELAGRDAVRPGALHGQPPQHSVVLPVGARREHAAAPHHVHWVAPSAFRCRYSDRRIPVRGTSARSAGPSSRPIRSRAHLRAPRTGRVHVHRRAVQDDPVDVAGRLLR